MRRDHDDARVGKHSSTLHRAPLTFTGAAAILESERRAREAGDAAAAAPFLLSGWMDGWMDKEEEKKKKKSLGVFRLQRSGLCHHAPPPKCENTAELEMKAVEKSRQRNPEW